MHFVVCALDCIYDYALIDIDPNLEIAVFPSDLTFFNVVVEIL